MTKTKTSKAQTAAYTTTKKKMSNPKLTHKFGAHCSDELKLTHKKLLARTNHLIKLMRTRMASDYRYHASVNDKYISIDVTASPAIVGFRFDLYSDGGYDVTMSVGGGVTSQRQHFTELSEQGVTLSGMVVTGEHRQQAMVFGEQMFRALSSVALNTRTFIAALRPVMDSVTSGSWLTSSVPAESVD